MAVSSSLSSRLENIRGRSLTRKSMSTPITDGKMSAVDGLNLSAIKPARHAACTAVKRKTAMRPRETISRSAPSLRQSISFSSSQIFLQRSTKRLPAMTLRPKYRNTPDTTGSGTTAIIGKARDESRTPACTPKPVTRVSITLSGSSTTTPVRDFFLL
eukprot:scaffold77164_cov30-Tisochrysis_lutea.AAC.6